MLERAIAHVGMREDHDAQGDRHFVLDHDSILQVQEKLSSEVTVVADGEVLIEGVGFRRRVVNGERRLEAYLTPDSGTVVPQQRLNQLRR